MVQPPTESTMALAVESQVVKVAGAELQPPVVYEEVEQSVFFTVHFFRSPPYWQYCDTQEVEGVQVGAEEQLPVVYEEVEQSVFVTVHFFKLPPYWQYCATQEVEGVQVG